MSYFPEIMIGTIREPRTKKSTLVLLHNGKRYNFDSLDELKDFLDKILSPGKVH